MLKLKILVIEDWPEDSKALIDFLNADRDGIVGTITLVESYDDALQVLSGTEDFDLSIIDKSLRGEISFSLIENFPKHRFGTVAFMTADDIPAHINRLAHPVLQIEKPFDKNQIASFINEVKRQKRGIKKHDFLQTNGKSIFITEDQIYHVTAINKTNNSECVYFNTITNKPDKFVSVLSKAEFLKMLTPELFAKCNGSCFVNVTHIFEIHKAQTDLIFDNPLFGNIQYSSQFIEEIIQKKHNS